MRPRSALGVDRKQGETMKRMLCAVVLSHARVDDAYRLRGGREGRQGEPVRAGAGEAGRVAFGGEQWGSALMTRGRRLAILFLAMVQGGAAYATGEDAFTCDSGLLESVAATLQASRADIGLSSCRRDPVVADQFIVAVVSPTEVAGQAVTSGDGEHFDLDVAIWNRRTHAVVAHRHDAGYLLSDASSLRSSSVDTARYILAPGIRAFGVRDVHYPDNTHSKWGETHLTLFVQQGDRIARIFASQVELLTDGGDTPTCTDAKRAIRTTVGTAKSLSHGYAELSVVTQDVTESGVPGKPCGPAKIERHQASYDGTTYAPVAIRMYLHPFD